MKTLKFNNNDELLALVKKESPGIKCIDFNGDSIECSFSIELEGVNLINVGGIVAKHINRNGDVVFKDIEAGNINCSGDIVAKDIDCDEYDIVAVNIDCPDGEIKALDVFAKKSIKAKSVTANHFSACNVEVEYVHINY